MIKRYCFIIIFFLFAQSSLLFTMQQPELSPMGNVYTTVFITEEIAAAGSDRGCFLIFNPTNKKLRRRECLHTIPTFNLISDKKNRLGTFCHKLFIAYKVTTQEKEELWSQKMNPGGYSAAFSYVDDSIFVYQNSQLTSNKRAFTILPFIGDNDHVSIACHPTKNEIMYPCSNTTLATRSFDGKPSMHFCLNILENDRIRRAIYNSDGTYIAVQTEQETYTFSTASMNPIQSVANPFYCHRHNFIFLPKTNFLLASMCNHNYIHYWHLHENREIAYCPYYSSSTKALMRNTLDFSPHETKFATSAEILCVKENCIGGLNRLILKYLLLKEHTSHENHYFPLDMVKLFIRFIYDLSPYYRFHNGKKL